tara:strand:+ start:62 stop:331 length:270 start_codon:yes stop_codon:yes gene_type:complete
VPSAKSTRASENRRKRKAPVLTQTRNYVKKARTLIEDGNIDDAKKAVIAAEKSLDKAAQKGVVHKGNAARRKSRLTKQLNDLVKSGGAQ